MDPTRRRIARLILRYRILRASGSEFEQLFTDIMSAARPDFRQVKPQGVFGDRHNDGFEPRAGRYFQVYSPHRLDRRERQTLAKLREDFVGLHRYWGEHFEQGIREFYFVLNDRYEGAVFPSILVALEDLRRAYGLERCEVFLTRQLEDELFSLDDEKIAAIIGFLPELSFDSDLPGHRSRPDEPAESGFPNAEARAAPCRESEPEDDPLGEIARAVSVHPRLTRLPSLFETTEALPLAVAYVDLMLAARDRRPAAPHLLEYHESPAERIRRREEGRYLVRRTPRQLLDRRDSGCALVLAGPGAGKSSLLRRIALDVAAGEWTHKRAPVFAEARRFWSRRKLDPGLSLLRYAIAETLDPPRDRSDRIRTIEDLVLASHATEVLLLVDGLDEIAADPEAVDCVYGELETLSTRMDWIATCRPAGLMRSCGERRRLDMAALDEESVERLIQSWSTASGHGSELASRLQSEIAAVPALRQMAANPFLLASLCFIKSAAMDRRLPISRVAVYEELIRYIGLQAQRRFCDTSILDVPAVEALSGFCYWLYDQPPGPAQIFSARDWQVYGANAGAECDLAVRILPARLIASWSEDDPHYHFVHLSLQEHLLGQAMLLREPDALIRKRFIPAWRLSFRAYAALLHYRGHREAFRNLVRRLYQERDLCGFALSHLAEIFADAGIRDTVPWLGVDLRLLLWDEKENLIDQGAIVVTDALALLDPDQLEMRAHESLDGLDDLLSELEEEYAEDFKNAEYPGEPYVGLGRDEDDLFRLLAKAATPSAHASVRDAFFGADQRRALVATMAFVDIARPSDRRAVVEIASQCKGFDDLAIRAWAFVSASARPELADFVYQVAQWTRRKRVFLFEQAVSLLVQMGTDGAHAHFQALFEAQLRRDAKAGKLSAALSAILRHVGELPVVQARALFDRAERHPKAALWIDLVTELRMTSGLSAETDILAMLGRRSTSAQAIDSLTTGVKSSGRMPSASVLARVHRSIGTASPLAVAALARLEAACIRAGGSSLLLLPFFLERAQQAYQSLGTEPTAEEILQVQEQLDCLFQPISAARHRDALTLLHRILTSDALLAAEDLLVEVAEPLLADAVGVAGDIIAGEGPPERAEPDPRISDAVVELLFHPWLDCAHAAAYALGRMDLDRLLDFRGAPIVQIALEQLSAEYNLLIFDDFWTDVTGRIHAHPRPLLRVAQLHWDDSGESLASRMAHHLARHRVVAFDAQDDRQSHGFDALVVCLPVTHDEPDDPTRRADDLRRLLAEATNRSHGDPPVFEFSELSPAQIVEQATSIAEAASAYSAGSLHTQTASKPESSR